MNHTATTRATGLATLATSVALAALMTGCKQELLCKPLGNCGGSPLSLVVTPPISQRQQAWVLAPGHPSCTEDLYQPARDVRLVGGLLPVSGKSYPEPALFDWCVLLVTGAGSGDACDPANPGVCRVGPRFYYESGPIGQASIKYDDTGHFSSGITRTGTFTLTFPAYCMRAFGATDPPMPAGANICTALTVPLTASGMGEGSYFNVNCSPNTEAARLQDVQEHPGLSPVEGPLDPLGCFCRFDVTETGGPSGNYQIAGDQRTIIHYPGTNFPQSATFCQQGDRLQLTGADGLYLFDQPGVRTFDLVRACNADAECTSGHCAEQAPGASVRVCGS